MQVFFYTGLRKMVEGVGSVMKQYELFQIRMTGSVMSEDYVNVPVKAEFTLGGKTTEVKGFYIGENTFAVRFLPMETGLCTYRIEFPGQDGQVENITGREEVLPAEPGVHGPVQAKGVSFFYADGSRYLPFGTTVYALPAQPAERIEETLETLEKAPFNKLRLCVFPKYFDFNREEPELFPFERGEGERKWNVRRPCPAFWDRLDGILSRLNDTGIEADLILFHPYDCWGFAELSVEEAKTYLEYAVRRLSAYPNLWWSLANEYDQMEYTEDEWKEFAAFIRERDVYGHLLSNHNFVRLWDFSDVSTTHCCMQSAEAVKIPGLLKKYKKPVVYDEVGYEGNIPYNWGNLSAFEEVNRFWKIFCYGGYATHGETYMEKMDESQVLWWGKGGTLKGESPVRIAFLKELAYSMPGTLTLYEPENRAIPDTQEELRRLAETDTEGASDNPIIRCMCRMTPEEFEHMKEYMTQPVLHYEDEVFLTYFGDACTICGMLDLPEDGKYRIDVIDVWEMTRKTVMEEAGGAVQVPLPGKPGMAVLAVKTE